MDVIIFLGQNQQRERNEESISSSKLKQMQSRRMNFIIYRVHSFNLTKFYKKCKNVLHNLKNYVKHYIMFASCSARLIYL